MPTSSEASVRPDPDPTIRTTEQVLREVGLSREIIETRLNAMDKAISLLQDFTDKQPGVAEVAASVLHLKELFQTQLKDRDVRVEQVKEDGEKAIAAALQAQKEAVGKTELGFTKELDAVKSNNGAEIVGLRREISDLKESQWRGLITIVTVSVMAAGVIIAIIFHH